jgi:hypothetical protein
MDKELITAAEYLTAKLSKMEADLDEIKKLLSEQSASAVKEVLLSRDEAVSYLKICHPLLLRLVKEGVVPAHKIPKTTLKRYKLHELEKCLEPVRSIKSRFKNNKPITNH